MKRYWPQGLLTLVLLLGSGMSVAAIAASAASTATAATSGAGDQAAKKAASASDGKASAKADTNKPASTESTAGGPKKTDKTAAPNQHKPTQSSSAQTGNQQQAKSGESPSASGFSYDQLVALAKSRAAQAYKAPSQIPKFLQNLDPDTLSQVTYKRDDALWKSTNESFQVMFYHPGSFYTHAVRIHVIDGNDVSKVPFDKDHFNYPDDKLKQKVPKDLGYAGFKVLHELDHPGKLDEVVSFLGASYFRALGGDEHYGLSARGLAIDTGSDNGEEFPNFTQFWLVNPGKQARQMTIYALLDSPSVAGAYKFVVTPGQATHTHVEATLFTRKAISKLGIAPLTSMFTWGENSLTRLKSYRPEAHDSDGMLISAANGEWLWRPLVNPQKLQMNDFDANNVRGFGLMQRDRNFDHYQSLEYQYERRPNAWITPDGGWGDGHLQLVEIPSDNEVNDNMVLYWVPKDPIKAGRRLHYAYDIKWSKQQAIPDSLGHVAATRVGLAAVKPGQPRNQVRVVIDFVGGELSKLRDPGAVKPRVNAARDVTLSDIEAVPNPHTGGWRLSFLVPTSALNTPLELRAYLAGSNGGGLTETWSYALNAP